jgi:hypothetical protein
MAADTDELRYSPWDGITLQRAVGIVEGEGFNVVDFTVAEFIPTMETPAEERRLDYKYWHLGEEKLGPTQDAFPFGWFIQEKLWKRPVEEILRDAGGHVIYSDWKKVFPFKFLLMHYPYRNAEHVNIKYASKASRRFNYPFPESLDNSSVPLRLPLERHMHNNELPLGASKFLTELTAGVGLSKMITVRAQCDGVRGAEEAKLISEVLCRTEGGWGHYFNCASYPYLQLSAYATFRNDGGDYPYGIFHIAESLVHIMKRLKEYHRSETWVSEATWGVIKARLKEEIRRTTEEAIKSEMIKGDEGDVEFVREVASRCLGRHRLATLWDEVL